MVLPFHHFEVLGPRGDLDNWLASLQDVGVCHLADALHELEGHAGIARPELRAEEVHAEIVRSEASRALRGVARVLPATARRDDRGTDRGEGRPDWTLGPGGVGEHDLLQLKDEACSIATAIGEALEGLHESDLEVGRCDAWKTALGSLGRTGHMAGKGLAATEAVTEGLVLSLPRSGRRARRLQKRLARGGQMALRAEGAQTSVVVLPTVEASSLADVSEAAASLGAEVLPWPEGTSGVPISEALRRVGERAAKALSRQGDGRATLTARVSDLGSRGRLLLDSLEDAEGRTAARQLLASTEQVVAARVYVRTEDEALLKERLHSAHGETVVLRALAEAEDAPGLPRRIASAPFAVLQSLLPGRFGEVSPAALLALLTPVAVGLVWADVAGGLLLLLAGGLLGSAAGMGSPRRDTAVLAQVGGLSALLLGVLAGRAFGPLGVEWFGNAWGQDPAFAFAAGIRPDWAAPFLGVFQVLGLASLAIAGWGLLLALRERVTGQRARARTTLLGALHFAVIAGVAAGFGASASFSDMWRSFLWPLAPAAGLLVLLLGGARRFLVELCLDLVGVLRLVAVAGVALLLFHLVLAAWVSPGVGDILLGGLVLLVAALAVVADPAHLAMGVPYDLALGGRRLRRPFAPFRRRTRRMHDG